MFKLSDYKWEGGDAFQLLGELVRALHGVWSPTNASFGGTLRGEAVCLDRRELRCRIAMRNEAGVEEERGSPGGSFWCGEKGPGGPIPRTWNVSGWPTVYVMDDAGVIRSKTIDPAALDVAIEKLVAEAERQVK